MNIIYVGTITLEIIQDKITRILNAMDVITDGGQTYRLNDTQGDVMVTRTSYDKLQDALDRWQAEYSRIENADSGLISLESNR